MRHVASLAIGATSSREHVPKSLPARCWHQDKFSDATLASQKASGGGGFKTSPGDYVPAMGVRAPAPYPAAWPLAHLFRADAEMLPASPGPPAPSSPPTVTASPGEGKGMASL